MKEDILKFVHNELSEIEKQKVNDCIMASSEEKKIFDDFCLFDKKLDSIFSEVKNLEVSQVALEELTLYKKSFNKFERRQSFWERNSLFLRGIFAVSSFAVLGFAFLGVASLFKENHFSRVNSTSPIIISYKPTSKDVAWAKKSTDSYSSSSLNSTTFATTLNFEPTNKCWAEETLSAENSVMKDAEILSLNIPEDKSLSEGVDANHIIIYCSGKPSEVDEKDSEKLRLILNRIIQKIEDKK